MKKIKNYNVSKDTLALLPIGKKKTIVYESHDCYMIEEKATKLMESSCRLNGSTIQGRTKGTEVLTGYSYKAPIMVKEEENLIFFPTCSPRLKECAWINSTNISSIHKKNDKCVVEFLNNEVRYNALKIKDNSLANKLLNIQINNAKERYNYYNKIKSTD